MFRSPSPDPFAYTDEQEKELKEIKDAEAKLKERRLAITNLPDENLQKLLSEKVSKGVETKCTLLKAEKKVAVEFSNCNHSSVKEFFSGQPIWRSIRDSLYSTGKGGAVLMISKEFREKFKQAISELTRINLKITQPSDAKCDDTPRHDGMR